MKLHPSSSCPSNVTWLLLIQFPSVLEELRNEDKGLFWTFPWTNIGDILLKIFKVLIPRFCPKNSDSDILDRVQESVPLNKC
jgi:hypothetical protein